MNRRELLRALEAVTRPLARKIKLLAQRSELRRIVYDKKIRRLQVKVEGGQPQGGIEHLEPFGYTSHPLPGAEPITLSFKGNGSHTVAILVNDTRYRLVIEEGETAIYNSHGDKVHIKKDRSISIEAALKVDIKSPLVDCTGIMKAQDFITHRGVKLDSHDHDENNVAGSPTNGPNV